MTVHGARSVFYTWAKNVDDDPEPLKHDLISAALCHKSATETDELYNRGTSLEKRRLLIQRWATFLDGGPKDVADEKRPRLCVVR